MESTEPTDYIYAQKKNREATAIKRFFGDPAGFLMRNWFSSSLAWNLPNVWLGLRIPHDRLLRGLKSPGKTFLGDVDVFGASLEPSLTIAGGIKWPPDLSYIAAIEAKAAYYNALDVLKAAGDKYNGRSQAETLCKLGFDRVALMRFVVTEPVDSGESHPWMVAAMRSADAMREYLNEQKGIFFKEDDPFGTLLISTGSVPGKLEHMAGGMGGRWLRQPVDNPYKNQMADMRKVIKDNLLAVMSKHGVPRLFPVLILACSEDKCGQLYIREAEPYAACPNCGKPPR